MEGVQIILAMREDAYGEALARGLGETEKRLDIRLVSPASLRIMAGEGEKERILITDIKPSALPDFSSMSKLQIIHLDNKMVTVSEVLGQILELAGSGSEKRWGKRKLQMTDFPIFAFYSPWGGSGTTSLVITAGRLLAGRTGKKAVYLNLTEQDQYRFYMEIDTSSLSGKKELLYRLKEHLPVYSAKFLTQDIWGLYFLQPEDKENTLFSFSADACGELFEELFARGEADLLLLDLGNRSPQPFFEMCKAVFRVINQRDCRRFCPLSEQENGIQIENRSAENRKEGNVFYIIEDEESFQYVGQNIKISASKSFSVGVRQITEYMEERILEQEIRGKAVPVTAETGRADSLP